MPSPNSIASLSRLTSLTGNPNKNAFFDPTGADADQAGALSALSNEADVQTGLNPTARHALAMRGLQDMLDEYDFKGDQRRDSRRRMDAAFLGPDGTAQYTPQDAANARDLQMGDERVAHAAANLPTTLHMQHETLVNEGQGKADAYWLPANQSMLSDTERRTEALNRSRYVDPVDAKGQYDLQGHQIDATGRTGAAQITAAGRSADTLNQGTAGELGALLRRGDVNPNDPDSVLKALQGFLTLRNGAGVTGSGVPGAAPGSGVPAPPTGAQGPDLSGLAPGHGRSFSDGPFAGQTWTIDASNKPTRVK